MGNEPPVITLTAKIKRNTALTDGEHIRIASATDETVEQAMRAIERANPGFEIDKLIGPPGQDADDA